MYAENHTVHVCGKPARRAYSIEERGKRKEERGKRKEERGKRKEERGKRKEERGKRKESWRDNAIRMLMSHECGAACSGRYSVGRRCGAESAPHLVALLDALLDALKVERLGGLHAL
jgi:hypothetical protein